MLQRIAVGVIDGKKHYQEQYDDLQEFPAVSVSTGGPNQLAAVTKGGDLYAFLSEVALTQYDAQFREVGEHVSSTFTAFPCIFTACQCLKRRAVLNSSGRRCRRTLLRSTMKRSTPSGWRRWSGNGSTVWSRRRSHPSRSAGQWCPEPPL